MRLPITKALQVANSKITEIYTVQEWADEMGFSSYKYFSHVFRNHFGIRPKEMLNQLRLDLFFKLIAEEPKMSNYEIAISMGLKDDKALNKFIKRHTGKAPSVWKNGERKK